MPAPDEEPELEEELELVDPMVTDAVIEDETTDDLDDTDDDDADIEGIEQIEPEDDAADESVALPARLQEQLLIDFLPQIPAGRILCTTAGRAQFAVAAAARSPEHPVTCHWFDAYPYVLTRDAIALTRPENLALHCASDFPVGEFDAVVLPCSAAGEAELVRDNIQAGIERLAIGGRIVVSTDNKKDHWLGEVLHGFLKHVDVHRSKKGTIYVGHKKEPLKKLKSYVCEVVFRDGERLLKSESRPGVFAHRRVDAGCRQLLNAMTIRPNTKVLDLGCGSGNVAIAAAAREPSATVLAVDSQCRAVECVMRAAELNALPNLTATVNATFDFAPDGTFDQIVMNPPYFDQGGVAMKFLDCALDKLKPGGELLVVMKQPTWYEENMPNGFTNIGIEPSKKYWLVKAKKRGGR